MSKKSNYCIIYNNSYAISKQLLLLYSSTSIQNFQFRLMSVTYLSAILLNIISFDTSRISFICISLHHNFWKVEVNNTLAIDKYGLQVDVFQ